MNTRRKNRRSDRRKIRMLLPAACLTVVLVGVLLASHTQVAAQDNPYKLVGYYSSYGIYEDYYVTDIPADELTHLNYAAVDVSSNGQCVSSDEWTDMHFLYPSDDENLRLAGNFRQLQIMRGEHPNLKILMTVGGWENSENFSNAALTPESRARLVRSCVTFMQEYLFDGIDLDWRYPVSGGALPGRPEDKENFTLLLAEFRSQLDDAGLADNKTYLLTMLAPPVKLLYQNYEWDRVHPYLDWINLMTFSFQGAWSDIASHQAPLYGNTRDPRGPEVQSEYNVDGAVNAYLDAGVPSYKLVIGIPFFAQAWQNVRPNDYFGLYQSASGVPAGTRPGGILYYRDMLPLLQDQNYVNFFDEEVEVPWLYSANERIALSYEDAQSVRAKIRYMRQHELGGIMIWQVNYDDKAQSLLRVAYEELEKTP